jgi:hypothetical protein
MATLTVITPTYAGAVFSPAAAAGGGDKFVNTGNELLYIKNGGGSTITLTLDAQTVAGLTITDPTVSITAGQEKIIGPFDPRYFTDSSGFLNLSYSAVTSVTVAVIQKN